MFRFLYRFSLKGQFQFRPLLHHLGFNNELQSYFASNAKKKKAERLLYTVEVKVESGNVTHPLRDTPTYAQFFLVPNMPRLEPGGEKEYFCCRLVCCYASLFKLAGVSPTDRL